MRIIGYNNGFLKEINSFDILSGVTLENLMDGCIAIDTASNQLIFRIGDRLLRFDPAAEQRQPGGVRFDTARNTHHLAGLMT